MRVGSKPRVRRGRLLWLLTAVSCLVAAASLSPARSEASFPGRNGLIAFDLLRSSAESGQSGFCFTPDCTDQRIRAVSPATGDLQPVGVCQQRRCQDGAPAWSADGRRLAFQRTLTAEENDPAADRLVIAVARQNGSGVRTIAEPAVDPRWSPDGKRLVFVGLEGESAVYTVSLGGGQPRRVSDGGAPDWSSRDRLAVVRSGPNRECDLCSDIYSMRPDGAERRRLTRHGANRDPSWSPQGTKLAYGRLNGRFYDVMVMNSDGTGRRRIVKRGSNPTWSPNGKRIAFIRGLNIYVARANGRDRPERVYTARNQGVFTAEEIQSLSWQVR